jgi:hypothetical protein
MEKKRFEWTGDDSFTGPGLKLEKGKTYDVEAFGEAIVAEWARTGHARILAGILAGAKKRGGDKAGGEDA